MLGAKVVKSKTFRKQGCRQNSPSYFKLNEEE